MIAHRRKCVKECGRPAAEHRRVCNTCRDRAWREKYYEIHLFKNLKASAKRRGLPFTITPGWWMSFCELTGFAEICGRTKGCCSIDRIESWRGYEPDNIQILSVSANNAKSDHAPPINSDAGPSEYYSEEERPW